MENNYEVIESGNYGVDLPSTQNEKGSVGGYVACGVGGFAVGIAAVVGFLKATEKKRAAKRHREFLESEEFKAYLAAYLKAQEEGGE